MQTEKFWLKDEILGERQTEWELQEFKSGLNRLVDEVKFNRLCRKRSLTDEQLDYVIDYAHNNRMEYLYLDNLRDLTNKQAEKLWRLWRLKHLSLWVSNLNEMQASDLRGINELSLKNLESITNTQLNLLLPKSFLFLDWLKELTNEQAESLSRVKTLFLNWLKKLTDEQAESLSHVKNCLFMNWLTSITYNQAALLSKFEWRFLCLDWLTSITNQAALLWKFGWESLSLGWLKKLTDDQVEQLTGFGGRLSLNWLTSITDKQAYSLKKLESLYLNEKILTERQKWILKDHIHTS